MTHAPYLGEFATDADEPAFLRRGLALLESGEQLEDEESPGITAVHWAPLKPRWTKHAPTVAGVYWIREPGSKIARVVDVYRNRTDGDRLWFVWSDIEAQPVRAAELEWSDRPIAECVG